MRNFNLFFAISILFSLMGCTERQSTNIDIELWKLKEDSAKIEVFNRRNGRLARAFRFLNDSIIDTKTPYFEILKLAKPIGWRDSKYRYLGTETTYKFKEDSLFTFDKTSRKWINEGKFVKTSPNLVRLVKKHEIKEYERVSYSIPKTPVFNKIIFSSSPCFGSCPNLSFQIKSDGSVVFYGKMDTDTLGVFEGKLAQNEFDQIERNFRLIEPMKLKEHYEGDWTDGFTNRVSFCIDDKVVKTVSDYDEIGPSEWIWACWNIQYLYQKLNLKRIFRNELPYFLNYEFVGFKNSVQECQLSDNFLLWNSIREGKSTNQAFHERFEVVFIENKIIENQSEIRSQLPLKNELKKVVSDGRFFRFTDKYDKSIVIDIGFNFFDLNCNKKSSKI